jgi:hypothetical protein
MKEKETAGKTVHETKRDHQKVVWGVPAKVKEEALLRSRDLLHKMKGRLRDGTHAIGRNMEKAGRLLQETGMRGGQRHH